MCGIIGIILSKERNAGEQIVAGLRKLEYRGYDSCGVAVVTPEGITVRKDVGKISEVVAKTGADKLTGRTGLGHCLHPDTMVQLANGEIRKIRDIGKEQVLSLSPETLQFKEKDSSCGVHAAPARLVEIRTPSFSLKCTPNHRMFIFDGEITEREAGKLRKNDIILCANKYKVKGSPQALACNPVKRYYRITPEAKRQIQERMRKRGLTAAKLGTITGLSQSVIEHTACTDRNLREDFLEKIALELELDRNLFVPIDSIHGKFVTLPKQTTPELMEFLGYLLGDGIVNERGMRFKDCDIGVLAHYNQLSVKLFNTSGRVTRLPGTKASMLEINSLEVCGWIRRNFPELTARRRAKHVPQLVGKTTRNEINAFIRGLFDAEGCVNTSSRQATMAMTSEETLRVIQLLLLRDGIISSYGESTNKWGKTYRLSVNNRDGLERFAEFIGSNNYLKASKLDRVLKEMSDHSCTCYKLPFLRMQLKPAALRKSNFNTRAMIDNPSITEVMENVDGHTQLLLQKYVQSDVFFQRVLSAEETASDAECVYDLQVDGTENFIANGLVSHNSRWATHGGVTRENSHPHTDESGTIAIVHNGIIENHEELRERLKAKGVKIVSQTDSELVAHVIAEKLKEIGDSDFPEACRKAMPQLHGSYALLCIGKGFDGIVCLKNESPLVIGYSPERVMAASDLTPLAGKFSEAIVLNDGEMAIARLQGVEVKRISDASPVEPARVKITFDEAATGKGGFEHYMLKEIMEQKTAVANALRQEDAKLQKFGALVRNARQVTITACGTSFHAGLILANALRNAGVQTRAVLSSEYAYEIEREPEGTLVVALSQSGETADVIASLKKCRDRGFKIVALTNSVGSSIDRTADLAFNFNAGPEIGVAATKTFSCQAALSMLLAGAASNDATEARKKMASLPENVEKVLVMTKDAAMTLGRELASQGQRDAYFIGRGLGVPVALEGALKLKEISYIHAEGMPAGELKHGPIALISKGTPVFGVNCWPATEREVESNCQEVKARGAFVVGVSPCESGVYDELLRLPDAPEEQYPVLASIPLQLVAYSAAVALGNNPDQPRNLAKAVTVR
ncbi:hypothetical protein AUJ14_03310 [Candidatus Micrarchaeota archaeon CG1_02_55_22]|nr:MAG: hypothetical protein AUJ14_03310 [Candidatus Micrarchaeota archaeon CG1_02_55_22]